VKGKKLLISLLAAVALVAVMVAPVMAATDTTEITGDVPVILELTAPSAIAFGDMDLGLNTATSIPPDGEVKCNNPTGYTLTVEDTKTTDKGHMTVGANTLDSPLLITIGDLTDSDVTVSRTVATTAAGSEGIYPLSATQIVKATDTVATGYTITLTLTLTANNP